MHHCLIGPLLKVEAVCESESGTRAASKNERTEVEEEFFTVTGPSFFAEANNPLHAIAPPEEISLR